MGTPALSNDRMSRYTVRKLMENRSAISCAVMSLRVCNSSKIAVKRSSLLESDICISYCQRNEMLQIPVQLNQLFRVPLCFQSSMEQLSHPIVFFDGVCGLCNSTVNWLMKLNRRKDVLRFAALQGQTAKALLPEERIKDLDSMAFLIDGAVHIKSTGILKSAQALGGIYKLARIALIIPSPLRDKAYDWIASNRYKWFGKHDACRIPTPEERGYFLP